MSYYRTCPNCGANLDPGERCGCQDKEQVNEREDREAQARSYGLSYGQFMPYVENGWKLPKQIRPIEWPLGSTHYGEAE